MGVLRDWTIGSAPRIDEAERSRARIGRDRVWVVGFALLQHHNRETNRMYPSRRRLSEMTGVDPRSVTKALGVLERSGVIRRVEGGRSQCWETTWTPSEGHSEADLSQVVLDRDEMRRSGVGYERGVRVVLSANVLHRPSAETVAEVTGVDKRQVRTISKMAKLELCDSRLTKRLRPDSRARFVRKAERSTPKPCVIHTPPHTPSGCEVGAGPSNFIKDNTKDKKVLLMPWDIFSSSSVPDESVLPSRPRSKSVARGSKPLKDWTPMDSAKEFVERYRMAYPMLPGETGNVVEIAKVLGKWRKDYDHDARVEMMTLDLWLADEGDVRSSSRKAPAWRRWLASFQRLRPLVDENLTAQDATYVDPWSEWEPPKEPAKEYDHELFERMVLVYAKPLHPHLFLGESFPRRTVKPSLDDPQEFHDAYEAACVYPTWLQGRD